MSVVPDQHGAWAFLILPLVLALPVAGWHVSWLPLAVGWVVAYPASWAFTGLIAGPRPERFRGAVLLWVPPALATAGYLVVARPWLVFVGAVFLACLFVHLDFARRRDERALPNDLLLVVECAAMVPVTVGVLEGSQWWRPGPAMWSNETGVLTLLCLLALTASVLHVKSRIRERRDLRYARAARRFAVLAVPVAGAAGMTVGAGGWLALPFAMLAARSWLVPVAWRPSRVGLVELACFVVLAVSAWAI